MILTYNSSTIDIGKCQQGIPIERELLSGERLSNSGIVHRSVFGTNITAQNYNFYHFTEDNLNKLVNFQEQYQPYIFQLTNDLGKTNNVMFIDNKMDYRYDYTGIQGINYYICDFGVKEVKENA